MTNLIITDPAQINDVWAGMEIEDAAKRAPALTKLAEQAHHDLRQQLDFLKVLVTPLLTPDKLDVLDRYFALAVRRADELAAIPGQAADVLTHAAFMVMQLMKQRNAKTAELAALIEALEAGNDAHPLLSAFADRLDERRMDYSHLEAVIGDDAAEVMADLFLGRGAVEPEALGGLIMALVGLYERKTGQVVIVTVNEAAEQQSA